MTANDAELMARYCDGDDDAFRELYALVGPRLLNYLIRLAGNRSLAEDLLQQTFLKAHRARSAYIRGAAPMPWLFAIAHRSFLDEMRRRKRARVKVPRTEESLPEVEAHITGKRATDVDQGGRDPEIVESVMNALETLPPNQREALVLTKLEGKSVAEAAEITGASQGAIKLRSHRAYVNLRKALARAGGEK